MWGPSCTVIGTLGGTRTRKTYDLNVVRIPIPPPGHILKLTLNVRGLFIVLVRLLRCVVRLQSFNYQQPMMSEF